MSPPRRFNNNKRRRNAPRRNRSSNDTSAPTQATAAMMVQPRFRPVAFFSRTVEERFDIACDGINPSLGAFVFTLSQLPDFTDFTNLFTVYRLNKIKLNWKPEYTELTDAALVSNAVNVNFSSAICQTDSNAPGSVQEVTQFQNCKSTGITKPHQRTLVPAITNDQGMICHCYVATINPDTRHYGLKYGIPPTGVAMQFRSIVTFYFELAGAR